MFLSLIFLNFLIYHLLSSIITLSPYTTLFRSAKYATHEGDTVSPEVQVAVLSRRISNLTEHLKDHPHDHHTRRGLMALVGRRRRMLQYLYSEDIERYRSLIERIGLRK